MMYELPVPAGIGLFLYRAPFTVEKVCTPFTINLIRESQPDILIAHKGPEGLLGTNQADSLVDGAGAIIQSLRSVAPDARWWYGVGCDYWTEYLGKRSNAGSAVQHVHELMRTLAKDAVANQIECVVFDLESAGKRYPASATKFAEIAVSIFREHAPRIKLGHTAYGVPVATTVNQRGWPLQLGEKPRKRPDGGHAPYPFQAFLRDYPVDFSLDQTYANTSLDKLIPPGELARVHAVSERSFELLERQGRMLPRMPRARINRLWGCPALQIVEAELSRKHTFGWATPKPLCDRQGAIALVILRKLRDKKVFDALTLKQLQQSLNIAATGIINAETVKALGIDPVTFAMNW